MHFIFSQAASKLLQQICERLATSQFQVSGAEVRAAAEAPRWLLKQRVLQRSWRCERPAGHSSLTTANS